jgi:hypothetical protein
MKQIIIFILFLLFVVGCSSNAEDANGPSITPLAQPVVPETAAIQTVMTTAAYPEIQNVQVYPFSTSVPAATISIDAMFAPVATPFDAFLTQVSQPTVTFTPEVFQRIPTTSTQLLQELPRSTASLLSASDWYAERIREDVIFDIIPVQHTVDQSAISLVVFWVKVGTDKLGQRTIEFSPVVASVLISDGKSYKEQWNTEQWSVRKGIESPLYTSGKQKGWYEQRFLAEDITGDNQPEVIISGCGGFGNQCSYSLGIWSLDGMQLFSTESTPVNIGATLSTNNGEPITREGIDFYRYNSVEMRPKRIALTFYTWNGNVFVKSKTEVVDFLDWDEPLVENM